MKHAVNNRKSLGTETKVYTKRNMEQSRNLRKEAIKEYSLWGEVVDLENNIYTAGSV